MNIENDVLIVAILDELIPPSGDGRIPGAGALGIAAFFPKAGAYAPDPLGTVTEILNAVASQAPNFLTLDQPAKVAVLEAVQRAHPEQFTTLLQLSYMGYYSQPSIRPLFGVGAHPVHPKGYAVSSESEELLDELTGPVRARGQAFRNI